MPEVAGDRVRMTVKSATPVREARLNYTTDSGPRSKRVWKSVAAKVMDGVIDSPRPPADANTWYISVTDDRGAMVSSAVQFSTP